MTLHVYTARLSYAGADGLNITRVGADRSAAAPGAPWAPSWAILGPILRARRSGRVEDWEAYARAFRVEMRASYVEHRAAWDDLLARDEVTLCCYCRDAQRCHRTLVARMLVRCGAVYLGERQAGSEG